MRFCFLSLLGIGLFAAPSFAQKKKDPPAPQPMKIFLEAEPDGWVDLLDKDLKNWKRVPTHPNGRLLKSGNPWKMSDDGKTLICDPGGFPQFEILRYDRELADGMLHFEWKFKPDPTKSIFSSGVYVRNSDNSGIQHHARISNKKCGNIHGTTLVNGKERAFEVHYKGPELVKGPGEWNTYEIVCKGPSVSLWINGYMTAEMSKCEVPKGYFGFESQSWYIEFRNAKWKEIK